MQNKQKMINSMLSIVTGNITDSTLAKRIRYWLMGFRIIFLPILYLKDFFGKESWQTRRKIVERLTLAKAILPLFLGILLELKTLLPPSVSVTVPEQFRWIFGALVLYCLSLQTADYLSRNNIEQFITLLHKQYKPKTVRRKIATLKAFFHYLEYIDILSVNPFSKLDTRFREPKLLPRTIPAHTIQNFLSTLYSQKEQAATEYQRNYILFNKHPRNLIKVNEEIG